MVLKLKHIDYIEEDPNAAYCPASTTAVPVELRSLLLRRQKVLMHKVLEPAGIDPHDTIDAPNSPYTNPHMEHDDVFVGDTTLLASRRYFVGHNLLASFGFGGESVHVIDLAKIGVLLFDKNVRVSSYIPRGFLKLEYENFPDQADRFKDLFDFLHHLEPGKGEIDGRPVLLGYEKNHPGKPIILEDAIAMDFPELVFKYDGNVPIAEMKVNNPKIFYEIKERKKKMKKIKRGTIIPILSMEETGITRDYTALEDEMVDLIQARKKHGLPGLQIVHNPLGMNEQEYLDLPYPLIAIQYTKESEDKVLETIKKIREAPKHNCAIIIVNAATGTFNGNGDLAKTAELTQAGATMVTETEPGENLIEKLASFYPKIN